MKYPIEINSLDANETNRSVLRILTGTGSRVGDLFLQTVSKTNDVVSQTGTIIAIESGLYTRPDPLYCKVRDVWNAAFEKTKQDLFKKTGKLPDHLFEFNKEDVVTFWPSQEILAFEHMRMDFIQNAHGFVGIRTGYADEDVGKSEGIVWLAGPDDPSIAEAVGAKRYQSRNETFGDLYHRAKTGEIANALNPLIMAGMR